MPRIYLLHSQALHVEMCGSLLKANVGLQQSTAAEEFTLQQATV